MELGAPPEAKPPADKPAEKPVPNWSERWKESVNRIGKFVEDNEITREAIAAYRNFQAGRAVDGLPDIQKKIIKELVENTEDEAGLEAGVQELNEKEVPLNQAAPDFERYINNKFTNRGLEFRVRLITSEDGQTKFVAHREIQLSDAQKRAEAPKTPEAKPGAKGPIAKPAEGKKPEEKKPAAGAKPKGGAEPAPVPAKPAESKTGEKPAEKPAVTEQAEITKLKEIIKLLKDFFEWLFDAEKRGLTPPTVEITALEKEIEGYKAKEIELAKDLTKKTELEAVIKQRVAAEEKLKKLIDENQKKNQALYPKLQVQTTYNQESPVRVLQDKYGNTFMFPKDSWHNGQPVPQQAVVDFERRVIGQAWQQAAANYQTGLRMPEPSATRPVSLDPNVSVYIINNINQMNYAEAGGSVVAQGDAVQGDVSYGGKKLPSTREVRRPGFDTTPNAVPTQGMPSAPGIPTKGMPTSPTTLPTHGMPSSPSTLPTHGIPRRPM
jgi:hypothetical protein